MSYCVVIFDLYSLSCRVNLKGKKAMNFNENTVGTEEYVGNQDFRNLIFVALVENNATKSSIWYFGKHVSYLKQNQRK